MRHPSAPTTLGVFFAYPSGATGDAGDYWLAANGTKFRMTGACKRAVLATIEAAIERAIVPACAGTTPPLGYNFKANALNAASGLYLLISLARWTTVASREGLGARFVRGCPLEDWQALIDAVSALWHSPSCMNDAGTVMAWQPDAFKWHTTGFVEDITQEEYSMDPLLDISSMMADEAAARGMTPVYRPWGAYAGGAGGAVVYDWIVDQLETLGVPSSAFGSWTPGYLMPDALNVTPSPFDTTRGHLCNWFAPSGGMTGNASRRRSSSGWAVLQAMLAQMAFTHLQFGYSYEFENTEVIWQIRRWFILDEDWNWQVYEDVNAESTQTAGTSGSLSAYGWEEYQSGASSIDFEFSCNNVNVPQLAELTRPQDGWLRVGDRVLPFLAPTYLEEDAVLRTLHRVYTSGISSVTAANGKQYPAPAFEEYCTFGGVTFIDRMTKYTNSGMGAEWTKWSVRQEAGNKNLVGPTRLHAQWLLSQLPVLDFPQVAPPDASAVRRYSNAWWDAWELYYPEQPNVSVDGHAAYFPTAIRNLMGGPGSASIVYNDPDWVCSRISLLFGTTDLAFPDYGQSSFCDESYSIDNLGTALAAHEWEFKAMPST